MKNKFTILDCYQTQTTVLLFANAGITDWLDKRRYVTPTILIFICINYIIFKT